MKMKKRANFNRPQLISKPALKMLWMVRSSNHRPVHRSPMLPDGRAEILTEHEDILVEILSRLPVKTLMRFRCVCTAWRSLIADPHFVKKHMKLDAERVVKDSDVRVLFSMKPPCSMGVADLKGLKGPRQSLKSFRGDRVPVRRLQFPVVKGTRTGYDYYESVVDPVIQVFSLRRGTWNTYAGPKSSMPGDPLFWRNSRLKGTGGFVNGVLHWLRFDESESSEIMRFSFAEEKFLEAMQLASRFGGILIWRNHLCVHSGSGQVTILMMKEYGVEESWTEVLDLTIFTVPLIYHEMYLVTPIWILENGDVLAHTVQTGRGGYLSVYKPKYKAFTNVIRPEWRYMLGSYNFEAISYRETLVSPITGSFETSDNSNICRPASELKGVEPEYMLNLLQI